MGGIPFAQLKTATEFSAHTISTVPKLQYMQYGPYSWEIKYAVNLWDTLYNG